jgi:hypothetical protein
MQNLALSRVTVGGTVLYIGGPFLVLLVLTWPAPMIIGIGCIKPTDTNKIAL